MSKKKKIEIEDSLSGEESGETFEGENAEQDVSQAKGDRVGAEDSAEGVTLNAEQFAELKAGIATVQQERDLYLERLQRLQAEFDNYRKRNTTLRTDSLQEGQRETVAALLPTLDNLERAIAAAEADSGDSPLLEGVRLVYRQFQESLQKLGVEEILCENLPFDPQWHNAIAQEPCGEGQIENTVTEVFQKGYKQGDKVIRHSMVKVSQ